MPHLTPGDVHVNSPLTNMSVAYRQELTDYVATKMAPVCSSDKKSDVYYKWNKGDLLRNVAQKRAPGQETVGSSVALTNDSTFKCDVVGIHEDVSWQSDANSDKVLNLKQSASRNVTQWLMNRIESDWATAYFKAAVWDTDWASTTGSTDYASGLFKRWDQSGSDPITDISQAIRKVHSLTGFWPKHVCFSDDAFETFKNHSEVIDRIKYTQRGVIKKSTKDIVADILDVNEVLVASAIINSANEGATDSIDNIMSNGVLVAYVSPYPAVETPSAMYTFSWTGLIGASQDIDGLGMRIKDIPMDLNDATRIEGEMAYDQATVCTDLGLFMDNVIEA